MVDQQAHPVRAELVVADPLREKVHVLRRNERHPRSGVGDLAVDPLPERAGCGGIALLLRLLPSASAGRCSGHRTRLRCCCRSWPGTECCAAEEPVQERRRGRVGRRRATRRSRSAPGSASPRPYPSMCRRRTGFRGHAVAERVQHLHAHPGEARRLVPRPDGDLHAASSRTFDERPCRRQVGRRPLAVLPRAGRVRAVRPIAGEVRRQDLARRHGEGSARPRRSSLRRGRLRS